MCSKHVFHRGFFLTNQVLEGNDVLNDVLFVGPGPVRIAKLLALFPDSVNQPVSQAEGPPRAVPGALNDRLWCDRFFASDER